MKELIQSYLDFLRKLQRIRQMDIDDEDSLSMLILFESVKSNNETILALEEWLKQNEQQ